MRRPQASHIGVEECVMSEGKVDGVAEAQKRALEVVRVVREML